MKTFSPKLPVVIAVALLLGAAQEEALAGSATWAPTASSGDWNTASNWVPNTIPNSPSDIATFATSDVTSISITTDSVGVDSIVFNSDADPYTISVAGANLTLFGAGIVNNSGRLQAITRDPHGLISFSSFATAGESTSFGGPGAFFVFNDSSSGGSASFDVTSDGDFQASLNFEDTSTAAEAKITINDHALCYFFGYATAANAVISANTAGEVLFGDNSTADHAVISVSSDGAEFIGSGIGFTQFATAANGRFTVDGATSSSGFASFINCSDSTTCGDARFIIKGGSAQSAAGTAMNLYDTSTAGNATIKVNGGVNGGKGASLLFQNSSLGGTARITLSGNGVLDISKHSPGLVTVGSIQGNGLVSLGAGKLAVGSNNLKTTFSGIIQDGSNKAGGSLTKLGTGTLILSGANTYTGGTTLSAGGLTIQNTTGSATGTGAVQVNAGNLAGPGIIAGAVTVGSGSGSGALLAPGLGATKPTTLTLQSSLTWQSDGTLQERLNTHTAQADGVAAKGVTINAGAQFTLLPIGKKKLVSGTVFTMINNTSANPINSAFANLADGATLLAGPNTLVADYSGGDGNDLTLTVQ